MSRDGRHVLMTEVYKWGWNVYTGRNFWMNSSSLMELYNGVTPGPFMIERIYMQPLAYLSLNLIKCTELKSHLGYDFQSQTGDITWRDHHSPRFYMSQVYHLLSLLSSVQPCWKTFTNHTHGWAALRFWFRREKRLRHPFITPSSYLKITKTQPKQHLAPGGTQILKNKQSSIFYYIFTQTFCLKHLTCGCEITKAYTYLAYLFLSNTMCCWLLGAPQILAIQFDSDWPHFLDVETCAEPSSWGFLELKGASTGSKKIDLQGFCWVPF